LHVFSFLWSRLVFINIDDSPSLTHFVVS
jgi:hypothetical protein